VETAYKLAIGAAVLGFVGWAVAAYLRMRRRQREIFIREMQQHFDEAGKRIDGLPIRDLIDENNKRR